MSEPQGRRGRISEIGDLAEMDLVAFNGGVNPFRNEFIKGGFKAGAAHYRSIVETWGFTNLERVADLGSGYGRWSVFLAEVNAQVCAFERNAAANDLARRLCTHFGLDNARFETCDITALPADAASFDAVWFYNTLQFVDRAKALKEVHRILKPGGLLHIGAYNGPGKMLARFFEAYAKEGVGGHTVAFGLRSLKNGPEFDGAGSYGSPQHMAAVLARHGFRLAESPAMQADAKADMPQSGPFAELLGDLPNLVARLESDAALAAEFAQHPEFAAVYPANVNLLAIRD